jgi:hypothetical protein
MPSTINADNGVASGITGVRTTADSTGNLAFQSNGVTLLTLATNNTVTISGTTSQTGNASFSNVTATAFSGPLNGTVGATTANTGAFTTLTTSSTLTANSTTTVNNGRTYLRPASEPYALGMSYNPTVGGQCYIGASNSATPDMIFSNNVGDEKMRLSNGGSLTVGATSGSLLLGSATAPLGEKVSIASLGTWNTFLFIPNTYNGIGITNTSGTATYGAYTFYNNGTSFSYCGNISVSAGAVAYTTASDYRLKENVVPIPNALETVAKLKPIDYTWKADGTKGQGFIAHELQEICPQAVIGEKDAIDEEGKPKYQGLDTSFLVAMLTKAIQELNAKVDAQAAEIAALKAGA